MVRHLRADFGGGYRKWACHQNHFVIYVIAPGADSQFIARVDSELTGEGDFPLRSAPGTGGEEENEYQEDSRRITNPSPFIKRLCHFPENPAALWLVPHPPALPRVWPCQEGGGGLVGREFSSDPGFRLLRPIGIDPRNPMGCLYVRKGGAIR